MKKILMADPTTGNVSNVEIGKKVFATMDSNERGFRIIPNLTAKGIKEACWGCLGYYSLNVPSCYMSASCPFREHRGGRLVHELRKYPLWFYIDIIGNVKYLISPTSSTHLAFFSKHMEVFIYGLFKYLKIQLHHGNQCSTCSAHPVK